MGRFFSGWILMRLSEPAFASAIEVLAANRIEVMIDEASWIHAYTGNIARHPHL